MIDPRVTEFERLIACTCCERHKKKRPTQLGVLHEYYPIQQTHLGCQFKCRQRSRMICRELYGCSRIGVEPEDTQELSSH